MPCGDGGLPYSREYGYYEDTSEHNHNSKLAVKFCELCQYLEMTGVNWGPFAPNAYKWWLEHKQQDEERIKAEIDRMKRESDKKKVLDRLTAYEKSLLGIRDK